MRRRTLNHRWRQMHQGITDASQAVLRRKAPEFAEPIRRAAEEFASLSPPASEAEMDHRRILATALIASWAAPTSPTASRTRRQTSRGCNMKAQGTALDSGAPQTPARRAAT